jgi:hypothetical protein
MCTRLAMYVQRYIKARSRNRCCSGKDITVTHSERVFLAQGIQHTMRMRHFISLTVACPALPYISILSHKLQAGRSRVRFPMVSLEFFIDITLPATMALWSTQPLPYTSTRNVFRGGGGGKGGRYEGLTTLPPSCADCLEIWEPQPPGAGLFRPIQGLIYLYKKGGAKIFAKKRY